MGVRGYLVKVQPAHAHRFGLGTLQADKIPTLRAFVESLEGDASAHCAPDF